MTPDSLDDALSCHIDWLGRVAAAAQDGRCPRDLLEETVQRSCAFGRWLRAARRGQAGPLLQDLERLHDQMHAEAAALLRAIVAGEDTFGPFEALSRQALAFNRAVADLRRQPVPA